MIKFLEGILIGSENAKALAEFYREKVGLKQTNEFEMGEGDEATNGFEFSFDLGPGFYIMDHSEVKGKNPNSDRIILNFEVDDIEAEVKKLDETGVKKVKDIYHVEDYGHIATFEDVDGNYFQLVKTRE
ncbi:hypothetical protein HYS97_00990 [Candidatus Daviesbacteria bacterium]|nr:hypothetical protein [Candidatus Daviesbacteria bacterium]